MRKEFSFILLMLVQLVAFGETFEAKVLDKQTNEPIPYANIYFVDLKTGTTSDELGVFKIEAYSQKNIHVQINVLGYKPLDEVFSIEDEKVKIFYLEEGHFDIHEVLVSGVSNNLQRENITNVSSKNLDEIQQESSLTLSETISNIPGVEQNSTGAGIGKPIIRGLSGNRIVTYAQGTRVENQQWGDEHGLGIGAVGIEKVEVIKGPASLLYGSDALGGVLYFVDERYAQKNTIESFVESKFLSNSLSSINSAGLKIHKGKFKMNLFGTYASHADYQTPNFKSIFNTRFDEQNIKAAFGFSAKNWISNIRYSFLRNNFGIVEDATYTDSRERNFILPFQSIDNHSLSFENTIFTGKSKFKLILGYSNNYRKEFEDDKEEHALGLKLNTFTYDLKWHSPKYKERFSFIVGSQGLFQNNKNDGEEILIPDANVTDVGAFVIANLDLKKLKLQAGFRTDFRFINTQEMITDEGFFPAFIHFYNGYTYSAGAVYKLDKTNFRLNLSSGFRAPNTSELLSDGVHEGTNRYEKGNINLLKENANQIDFSVDYEDEHFSLLINPFYNNISNYIYLSPTDSAIDGNPVFEYLQKNVSLFGGELSLHYHPHQVHWLHLESNVSTVFGQDNNGNPLPLIPQTKINSIASAEIEHKGKFQIKKVFLQHIYKFQQNRTSLFETTTYAYNLLNLGLDFKVPLKKNSIEINTGVKNLLNTDYTDHLSRFKSLDISNQGINFYLGIKVNLETKI